MGGVGGFDAVLVEFYGFVVDGEFVQVVVDYFGFDFDLGENFVVVDVYYFGQYEFMGRMILFGRRVVIIFGFFVGGVFWLVLRRCLGCCVVALLRYCVSGRGARSQVNVRMVCCCFCFVVVILLVFGKGFTSFQSVRIEGFFGR